MPARCRRTGRDIPGACVTLYVSSLLIACGICLFAGVQSMFARAVRAEIPVHLAFGCLSVLVAVYLLMTAALYQTDSVVTANAVTRTLIALACMIYPVAAAFVSLYTGLRHWRRWSLLAAAVFGALLVLNAFSPYGLLYLDIARRGFIVNAWGETMTNYVGHHSPRGSLFYAAVNASYLWAIGCCIALWRRGRRARAWPLTLYMLLQGGTAVHAEIVYRSGAATLTYTPLAFLALVLLMGDALRRELRQRGEALNRSLQELRAETRRRQDVESDLRHRAYHDPLTGLPNRQQLHERVQAVYASGKPQACILIMLDLDHFKTINEALGHDVGDSLLVAVAERLRQRAPAAASIARIGGDEFALLLHAAGDAPTATAGAAQAIAQELAHALGQPFHIGDHELAIGVSAGIALHPGTATDADGLLRQVNMALHRAKAGGRHAAVMFEHTMQAAADRRLLLEKGLRLAIERNEFELHYQPQVDMLGRFVGAEALLRWRHPRHGLIEPGEFIPIAEETGLIHAIGREVLRRACVALGTWPAAQAHARMSINVSPWQLFAQDFAHTLLETVEATGADPARITLEITENAFLHDLEDLAAKMRSLGEAGFHFALDDFGSGYTSMESLKKLPVRELKIDRVFVVGLQAGTRDSFVEAMIAIAHHLRMLVVGEGVETEQQRQALAELGCDAIQGFLASRPLPPGEFAAWLQARGEPEAMAEGMA